MLTSIKIALAILFISLANFGLAINFPVRKAEWALYKGVFNKVYWTAELPEIVAQYNYLHSLNVIYSQNVNAEKGLRTDTMRINQYSDMKQQDTNVLFPLVDWPRESYDSPPPHVRAPAPPASFDPIARGFQIKVENQGMVCNSGWAYATAKAIEVFRALKKGERKPRTLSAQNLIDCAGRHNACRNQNAQQAFDYLTVHGQELHPTQDFPNRPSLDEPDMCLRAGEEQVRLRKYARIADGDDEALRKYVGAGYPVVVEFNPTTFDFIHYAGGVFFPPRVSTRGSHFMTVIGYGHDSDSKLDYWLLQNSFGELWGEQGRIRIIRSAEYPLAKSAIFPTELA